LSTWNHLSNHSEHINLESKEHLHMKSPMQPMQVGLAGGKSTRARKEPMQKEKYALPKLITRDPP